MATVEVAAGRRQRRGDRWLGWIGAAGLALFAAAYWLTYEPAPRVRVLWRADLTQEQRAALERQYLLVNGREPTPEGTVAYDLLDTSRSNIAALVGDPAIVDTTEINRDTLDIPFAAEYGGEWMWIAYRVPGLRDGRLRAVILLAFAMMAAGGLAGRLRRRSDS